MHIKHWGQGIKYLKKTATLILAVVILFGMTYAGPVGAQESESERRVRLERELKEIEKEIADQEAILNVQRQQTQSLERDVAILNAEIRKSELAIEARNIAIQRLSREILSRERIVAALSEKMDREKDSMANLFRRKNEFDSYSLIEIMLGSENISDFFEDLDSFDSINSALDQSFDHIRETQDVALAEKQTLAIDQSQEAELRQLQQIEKGRVEDRKEEKSVVLGVSKGQEAIYAQVLAQKQQQAAEIRARLFELRGTGAIPFGRAYDLAKVASGKTGVRPALILAVLKQESNIGQNVGNCNYKDAMHPDRDVPIFLDLMKRLGRNPDSEVVSCKPWYGWGGAMGPAQFIPSTWVLYEDQLKAVLGHTPDPWNPADAIMANALLLADNGATSQTYAAERLAALRYFAGWGNATNPSYAFYGDDVMRFAGEIQADIDVLENSN